VSSALKGTDLDLGALFPALRTYCPILYGSPSIHDHPRQCAFLLLDELEAFYGGAAGGGKSAALLAAALEYVDVPGYAALLLRRTFPQLTQPDMLIPLAEEWLSDTDARSRDSGKHWTFPSGAVLQFGHVKDEQAKYNYQGGGYHFIGFDELPQFTESQYRYISFSRARRRKAIADLGIPLRIRGTGNPGGIGHAWVKQRLVESANREPGAVFIPAKVWDNPGLDVDEYASTLSHLDPVLVQQLLHGDWGAFEGLAFLHFRRATHVVDQFPLDPHLERYGCMDYGINNATAWYLVAVDHDGNQIFCDSEYWEHGALPSESAPVILANMATGWGRDTRHWGDPNSLAMRIPVLRKWGEPATIETEFQDNGLHVLKGNDNPRAGYVRLRELIEPDPSRKFPDWHPRRGELGSPRLFIVGPACPELVDQFESAPLQPIEKRHAGEMIDPTWEGAYGHAIAAARYGVLSRPGPTPTPAPPKDPRAALLERVERQRDQGGEKSRYQDV
jgi:hypothetical protein